MPNGALFILLSLIWGSTWIAIDFQLGNVAPELSVAIRFSFSSLIFGLFCYWKKLPLRLPAMVHFKLAAIGMIYYAIEYSLIYSAQKYLLSAVVALMSASIIYINVFMRYIFLGKQIRSRVLVGATLGTIGMALIFYPQFSQATSSSAIWWGIFLASLSFICSGIGNTLAENTLDSGLNIVVMNFYSMGYGAILLWFYCWFSGVDFSLSNDPKYYISLAYLTLFGSVIAFSIYMKLLSKMGSDKASYVVLVFPIVALIISTLFEGYQWSLVMFIGLPLVLIGNYTAMRK